MKRFLSVYICLLLTTIAVAQLGGSRAPSTASGSWWANAVFYQVFVRSFQDSDGNGIGDLNGLTSRLDDLKTLGVTALWLNPIHPSPSYHGYDVTDYTGVSKDLGTLEDFAALMVAAKQRGLRVILDYVPNHTSSQHPWFLESKNPDSPKRHWYLWRENDPGWKNPLGGTNSPWRATSTGGSPKVIFAGTIQSALGAQAWNPNGDVTRAVETASGVFEFVAQFPKGRYEYKVAVGGSWSENYGKDGKPDGANIGLEVAADDTIVKFVFDRNAKRISDSINNPDTVQTPSSVPPRTAFSEAPGKREFYYAPFWEGMPDLNWRNPEVKAALFEAAKVWLERGVDGFRVDAVRYMFEGDADASPDRPETINWTRDFTGFVRGINPEAAVVTEAWADTATVSKYFVNGAGQQMGFDFDLQKAIRDSSNAANPTAVRTTLERVAATYPPSAVDAIFTSNHDLERMKFFNSGRYRSAATLLLTLPGTPFIYYGEEIGMPNGSGGRDEDKRTPMRWDTSSAAGFTTGRPWQAFTTSDPKISVSSQREQPGSLYNLYRNLIRIRQGSDALRVGGYEPVPSTNPRVFAFARVHQNTRVVVAINLDSDPQAAKLTFGKARGKVKELTLEKTLESVTDANASSYALKLSGYGFVVLELR
jgi:glycosidase